MIPVEKASPSDRVIAQHFDHSTLEQIHQGMQQLVQSMQPQNEAQIKYDFWASKSEVDTIAYRISDILHAPIGFDLLLTILPSLIEAAKRGSQR